ncbi:MAG: transposase [Limnochordaceae bacterium]|nr:transposase [Limnochordaceae bacterium]
MRPRIERIVRQLKRDGARKARYFGRFKVHFQLLLAAINHNIKEVMAAGPPVGAVCPA